MTARSLRGRVSATHLILVAALAAAVGLWAASHYLTPPAPPKTQAALMYPAPRAVADFDLERADGGRLGPADWHGHWTVVFFGFTHCPDVCPTTLATFKQVWAKLAERGLAERLRFDFISVDPQRDHAEQLASYVGFFSKDFVAATGSDEQLTRLTRSLGLLYAREPDGEGGYTVDHSASVVLIDPEGRLAGLFRPPFVVEPIVADLALLAGSR